MKVDVERFGYNNLLQGFKFMKSIVKIAMAVWWNSKRKKMFFFKHTFFSPIISSNFQCYFNNTFHEFEDLKKFIITKTFNVDCFRLHTVWFNFLIYLRGSLNKFPDFFRMGTFIDNTHMEL